MRERTRSTGAVHPALLALALLMLLALLLVLGTLVGSAGLQWPGSAADAVAQRIAFEIRLPRTLGAVLVGALLGLAGAVAQGVLFASTSAAGDLATDIEQGFFERLLASPVSRTSILLGRLGRAMVVAVVQVPG
ncbi:MAG: iron chelate uptake ABC transporter family permease subunit, partial [Burkholderiaceae bacterium]